MHIFSNLKIKQPFFCITSCLKSFVPKKVPEESCKSTGGFFVKNVNNHFQKKVQIFLDSYKKDP